MSGAERKALKNELKALQRRQTGFAGSGLGSPAFPSSYSYARRIRAAGRIYDGRARDLSAQIAAIYARLQAARKY